jgi:hypothetical protein
MKIHESILAKYQGSRQFPAALQSGGGTRLSPKRITISPGYASDFHHHPIGLAAVQLSLCASTFDRQNLT